MSLLACAKRGPQPSDAGATLVVNPTQGCDDQPRCDEACHHGSADDCLRLGNTFATARVGLDEARAAGLFLRACDLGNGNGCTFAGRMYEFAHGVPKDEARAASLYQRGCDLHAMAGCYNWAIMLEKGRGTAKDTKHAQSLYRTVCNAGASAACDAAARYR